MDRRGRNPYYSHNLPHGAAPGGGGSTSILLGFLLGMGAIVIGAICICILYFGYTYADRLENLESGIRAVAAAERAPAPAPDVYAAEAAKAAAAGVGESIARILEAQRDAAGRNVPAPASVAPVQAPSPQIYLMMGGQGPNGGLHYNNAPAAFMPQNFPAASPGSPQAEINQFVASKYQAEFSEYLRQRALQNANANGMFHTGSPYSVPGLSPISLERQYVNSDIPVPKKMTIDLKRRFSRDESVEQWFRDEAALDLDFDPDAVGEDGLAAPETNDPQLDMVLRGLAESTFYDKQYERSARVYAELAARSVNLSVVELNRWAKASELAGDTESAVRILELVVKIDPDNLDILKEIAQLQVVGGNFSAAAETYLRLMNKEPGNRDWRMWRAKTLTWSDRGREAVELMRDLYREDPTDMELNLMLADLLLSLHEFGESLPLLDALIAHKPDDDTLRVRKMNALMALQRFMDAAEIGADLLTRYPEDTGLLLKQAKNYLAAGEYQLAIEPYSLYLAHKPDDIEVRKEYAENLMAAQEFSIAAGEYREVLDAEPDNDEIHKKLANAYMAANDFRSAAIEYESLAAVYPDDEEINLGLVTSLRMSGQDAAALQAAKTYLRRDPYNQKVLVQAAGLAMAAGDTEHGLAWYRTAIRLDPTDFESRIELGNALIGAAKYDVAEHEFRRALVFDDGNMLARRGLARSLFYQRKYTESFDIYKRMTWEVMDEGLLLEYKYRQAVANGKEIEASHILTQLQEVAPEDKTWASDLHQSLLRQHRFAEAKRQYRAVIADDPSNRNAYLGDYNMRHYLTTYPVTLRAGVLRKTSKESDDEQQDRRARLTSTYIGLHGERSLSEQWRLTGDLDRENWNLRTPGVSNVSSFRFGIGGIFEGHPNLKFRGSLGYRWFNGSDKEVMGERDSPDDQWLYNLTAEFKELAGSNLNLTFISGRREHYDNYLNVYNDLYAYDFGIIPHYRWQKWDFHGELISSILSDSNTRLFGHVDAKYRLYETPCFLLTLGGNIEYENWQHARETYYSPQDMYKYGVDLDGRYYFCRNPEVWGGCESSIDFGLSIFRDRFGSTGQKLYLGASHDYNRKLSAYARLDFNRESYYNELRLTAGVTYAFGGCE